MDHSESGMYRSGGKTTHTCRFIVFLNKPSGGHLFLGWHLSKGWKNAIIHGNEMREAMEILA